MKAKILPKPKKRRKRRLPYTKIMSASFTRMADELEQTAWNHFAPASEGYKVLGVTALALMNEAKRIRLL